MNTLAVGLAIVTPELRDEVIAWLRDLPVRVIFEQPDLHAVMDSILRLRPDVLIAELSGPPDQVEQRLRTLRAAPGEPSVIALQKTPDPEVIVAAMRGGASEYLYAPFGSRLKLTLERIAAAGRGELTKTAAPGKTVGFFSAKGGCGATTVACHIALEFQRRTEDRILLADFDVHAGLIRFLLKTKSPYSVLDAAANLDRLDPSFWKALISNGTPRLEVIAGPQTPSIDSDDAPELSSLREVARFARSHYDWILVDLGRSLNQTSIHVIEEIDESFLVTTPDVPALFRTRQVAQLLLESGYPRNRLHIILNRLPRGSEATVDAVRSVLGHPVYGVLPEDRATIDEAYAEGRTVSPASPLGSHFTRLGAKILGIGLAQPKEKRRFSIFGA